MQQWFSALKHREQIILVIGASLLFLWVVYQALWQPLHGERLRYEQQNQHARESLKGVVAMVQEIQSLGNTDRPTATSGNLQQILNTTTREHGLRASRIQPNSKGEVQMRFEGVASDSLLLWLHELELRRGVLIRDASFNKVSANKLNASVRFAKGN